MTDDGQGAGLTPLEEWRKYAFDFGQANWTPEGFADRMEAAGYCELREVTDDDLEEAFAEERGIERGGCIYEITPLGHASLEAGSP